MSSHFACHLRLVYPLSYNTFDRITRSKKAHLPASDKFRVYLCILMSIFNRMLLSLKHFGPPYDRTRSKHKGYIINIMINCCVGFLQTCSDPLNCRSIDCSLSYTWALVGNMVYYVERPCPKEISACGAHY